MPQQIDVPGMGIVEFPDGMNDADITAAIQKNIAPQKPFLEKLGNFARKVYENPPPFLGGLATLPKRATEAAQELTYGADPEAAREAAGTALEAASVATPMAPRGTGGIFARPTAPAGTPILPPRPTAAAADPAVEAATRLGIEGGLPRYMTTESTVAPQFAAGVKNVPWAGQPVVQSAEKLTSELGRAKGEIAPAMTPDIAGERARSSLEGFTTTRSQKPVSEAYKAVDDLINPDVRVPLTHTAELVRELNATRANARIPGTSKAVDIVSGAIKDPLVDIPPELRAGIMRRNPELAQSPGMDYTGIKDLRTYLRNKTPQQLITEGIDPTEAKRILGTLTKDLENVVSQSSPEALTAWREANALASRTGRERQALTRTLGVKGNASAEQVFNRLQTYAGSKSGADLQRLRLAKRAMGPAAWDDVGSAMINRMGMAPDGAFSPDRFVTAFGNMSGAAKAELFSGQRAAALQDMFLVSNLVKDRITKFGNPSGTARGLTGAGLVTGGYLTSLAEPISAIASVVGLRMAASALSKPTVVRAATAVSRAAMSGNPVATQRALAVLRRVVAAEGIAVTQPQQGQQP